MFSLFMLDIRWLNSCKKDKIFFYKETSVFGMEERFPVDESDDARLFSWPWKCIFQIFLQISAFLPGLRSSLVSMNNFLNI